MNHRVELFEVSRQLAMCSTYCSTITACLVMNKRMEIVAEMAVKLNVDVKSLLMSCLPHILVHILPLSAAAAADQQAKLTAVGFECYNMLITELGKQVSTNSQTATQYMIPSVCQSFTYSDVTKLFKILIHRMRSSASKIRRIRMLLRPPNPRNH